ncbi:MAG: peptide deformylase [Proteobacteria bacterium]|nr:peptide deformylase [Pseudomonadota bacterium]
MKILPLATYPDPLLKEISKPVEKVDEKLQKFMDDMVTTMHDEGGIGLAAVQVGVTKRILVMDEGYNHRYNKDSDGVHQSDGVENSKPIFIINPKIIESSKELSSFDEGCLSFPDIRVSIKRPAMVKVEHLDYHGNKTISEFDGILATCVQHEMDHLNGITLIDHLSKLKREMVIKKMKKTNK